MHDLDDSFIKIFYGPTDADNALLIFIDRTKKKIDSCVSSAAPSVIIEVDSIKQKRIDAVKNKGIKLRYVTEITKDNIKHIKEMLAFSEIRHLDGIKGNFEVSDEKEYVSVATLNKAQSLPHLLFSNISEVVEQQQFIFDSFWKMAIPAEHIIKEIEHGVVHPFISVISDYKQAEEIEKEMIKKAGREIQILYSTSNAFYLQERGGILSILKEAAEKNAELQINILLPIDSLIKKNVSFNQLNDSNIVFQDIAPSINTKIKSLVVDRKEALIVELKHLKEERQTASIGFSIYSNSESIVLSYASIFEVLYNQSILFIQMKEDENIKNEFINIAAHELRTPIMPILNGMEIMEEKLGNVEKRKYKREMDIITRNAIRLQNLAESILQVSKIESGRFTINIQKDVDIHTVILQVIEDIEKKYVYTDKAKKVSILFEHLLIDDMEGKWNNEKECKNKDNYYEKKSSISPLYLDCDPGKIIQVVFNLLDNAIKFTSKGLVVISTTFQRGEYFLNNKNMSTDYNNNHNNNTEYIDDANNNAHGNNNSIIVTIEDTGLGINPIMKDQLFEKFSSRSAQGTGLGLYLSKKIIESHGGKLWYEEPNNRPTKSSINLNDLNINNNNDSKKQKITSIFKFSLPIFIDKVKNSCNKKDEAMENSNK